MYRKFSLQAVVPLVTFAVMQACVGESWPPWVWSLLFAAGGVAFGFALALAQLTEKRIREDGDPSNDWQADILAAMRDALDGGDNARVRELIEQLGNRKRK